MAGGWQQASCVDSLEYSNSLVIINQFDWDVKLVEWFKHIGSGICLFITYETQPKFNVLDPLYMSIDVCMSASVTVNNAKVALKTIERYYNQLNYMWCLLLTNCHHGNCIRKRLLLATRFWPQRPQPVFNCIRDRCWISSLGETVLEVKPSSHCGLILTSCLSQALSCYSLISSGNLKADLSFDYYSISGLSYLFLWCKKLDCHFSNFKSSFLELSWRPSKNFSTSHD